MKTNDDEMIIKTDVFLQAVYVLKSSPRLVLDVLLGWTWWPGSPLATTPLPPPWPVIRRLPLPPLTLETLTTVLPAGKKHNTSLTLL